MAKNQFVGEYGELSNEIMLNVAEILAIRLPEGDERIIAAKWVKKFNVCDPKVYEQYLTLFVSCLTKKLLVAPFDKPPADTTNQWKNFDREYTQKNINDAAVYRLYIDSFTPPYQIDMSSNFNEYVAYQEIPFFGAHFFYAYSPCQRIDKWTKFNKMNVPRSFVEDLRKDDPIESPIKGRAHPRPEFKAAAVEKVKLKFALPVTKAEKAKKPGWTELLPQDEPAPEPERKSMIVIPTETVKNIPPALQRRMAKAEQERQERLARKSQENQDRTSKLAMPKKPIKSRRSSMATPQKRQPPKSIKSIRVDDIDAVLMSTKPSLTQIQEPQSPEFTGPHADLQRRLFHLRQSNQFPLDLVKTTQDISQASADVNKEAERLKKSGMANLDNVNKIQHKGLSVGQRILDMLREHQANEIQKLAENAVYALENVYLTMDDIHDVLERSFVSHDDAVNRLNVIKERMQRSAFEAQNISIQHNGQKLVNALDNIAYASENSAQRLQNIAIETDQESILIEGLEVNCLNLTDAIQQERDRLSKALDNNEPTLLPLLMNTVKTVDDILFNSLYENNQLIESVDDKTRNAIKAIEIDTQKNEELDEINSRAFQILHDVENAVAKIIDVNASDGLIDIDNEDLGFLDLVDESEMERQRQFKIMQRQEQLEEIQQRMRLIQVESCENLFDVSAVLIDDIEKSITEIGQVLIPGLQQLEMNAENQRDQEAVQNAIESIEAQGRILNDSFIQMMNLRDAVADEVAAIDRDLMTFEDDLITFD